MRNKKGQFVKGHKPWNTGKKGLCLNTGKTHFKKGHLPSFIGRTKEDYEPLKRVSEKLSKIHKGKHYSPKTEFKEGQNLPFMFKKGKEHWNWKGGIYQEKYNLKEFNRKFKRAIRKRDNYICMLCGIHSEKLNRALCIHHIDYNKLNTLPQNCISLCLKCHNKTNINRESWIKFFQSLLIKKYNYNYSEKGEIILQIQ